MKKRNAKMKKPLEAFEGLKRLKVYLRIIFTLTIVFVINTCLRSDDGHMLVRLSPKSMAQWEHIQALDLEVVSEIPSPEAVDVLILSSRLKEIEATGIESLILIDSQHLQHTDAAIAFQRDGTTIEPEFHTYEEVGAELDSFATAYPQICVLDTIGYSQQEGRIIWALKISDNAHLEEDEPAVLYNGVHHACEVMGLEICMYMINFLVSNYGTDGRVTNWIDNTEIWFVPLLNPDGHSAVTSDINTFWRKNGRELNDNGILYEYLCNDWWTCYTEGINLNRNYGFNWTSSGSGDPWHYDYRGPFAFSESENQALQEFATAQKFVFSISYHSYGEIVFYPWNWGGSPAPDDAVISSVAAIMASRIGRENGGIYDYGRNGALSGMSANWLYGELGTIDFMIEVNPYPIFIPSGNEVGEIAQRNMNGAVYLLDRVRGPGLTGHITEAGTSFPLSATVKILEMYSPQITPRTSEPLYGRYHRILTPGEYTVEVSKDGYETQLIHDVMVGTDGPSTLDVLLRPTPELSVSTYSIDDDTNGPSQGNGNNEINFGERIELMVDFQNPGDAMVQDVTAVLRTNDTYVQITDSVRILGDIASGETASTATGFIFTASTDIPDDHTIFFTLTLQDALSRGWVETLPLHAVAPEFVFYNCSIHEGSGNGLVDPGESVELFITLLNTGGQEAQFITAHLRSDDPYVTVETDHAEYGLILPDSMIVSSTPFVITIGSDCPVPHSAWFELDIEGSGDYSRFLTFALAVGEVARGDANLDGTINILDVLFVINEILDLVGFNSLQFTAADMNTDGTINILDVVLIVNAILGAEP
jgi:carboxypeptidase T